ncbi:MAG: hypothetical protein KAR31_05610 [Candidatus Omnitrophica bacterium]|nr:hypothetical protein [Candidatus Omnitrophota bacterium]
MLRGLKKARKEGFASIVEVAVTSVIFILATAGILSTVSMLKPHGEQSLKKIEAAYIGKGIIDELRQEVHASAGGLFGGNLALGVHNMTTVGDYTVSYIVTEPIPNLRRLTMNITWPD